jgi:hypothetical protein
VGAKGSLKRLTLGGRFQKLLTYSDDHVTIYSPSASVVWDVNFKSKGVMGDAIRPDAVFVSKRGCDEATPFAGAPQFRI